MIRTFWPHRLAPARPARRLATLVGGGILASALSAQTPPRKLPAAQTPNPCRAADRRAGQVTGTVSDPQGGRAAGAAVSVRCRGRGPDRRHRQRRPLHARPAVRQPSIPRHARRLRAGRAHRPGDAGTTATLDLVLQLAGLADAVTVRRVGRDGRPADRRRRRAPIRRCIETPQSVSVITAKQIHEQASPNIQEALRYTPACATSMYGIDNRGDWFSLRGSDQSTVAAQRHAPAADRLVRRHARRALRLRSDRRAARAGVDHRRPERPGRRASIWSPSGRRPRAAREIERPVRQLRSPRDPHRHHRSAQRRTAPSSIASSPSARTPARRSTTRTRSACCSRRR